MVGFFLGLVRSVVQMEMWFDDRIGWRDQDEVDTVYVFITVMIYIYIDRYRYQDMNKPLRNMICSLDAYGLDMTDIFKKAAVVRIREAKRKKNKVWMMSKIESKTCMFPYSSNIPIVLLLFGCLVSLHIPPHPSISTTTKSTNLRCSTYRCSWWWKTIWKSLDGSSGILTDWRWLYN